MPHQVETQPLRVLELSDDVLISGSLYTDAQILVIQNYIAEYTVDQLSVSYSDNEPLKAAMQVEFCKGARSALARLLDAHNIHLDELPQTGD